MKKIFLSGITKDSDLEDDMFIDVLETEDTIERTKYIEDIRKKCREVGRQREFDNILKAWTQKNAQLKRQEGSKSTAFTDSPLILKCGSWTADDAGVKMMEIKNDMIFNITACPHPILPVERMVNVETDMEKVKLAFFKDSRWRYITVDCTTIFNRNHISNLSDRGVIVTSESAKDLVKYLAEVISLNVNDIPLYKSISRLGWVGDEFAPYVKGVKYDGDADFQSAYDHVQMHGSYDKWLEHITELRKDINIRLMLATSFASVLIEKVGALPFILHLWGTTGFGKTVSLMVSASVWGNPDTGCLTRSMNMTQNAMARTSSFLYSIPFCADELQQIKTRWDNYDNLVMYLCEGIDRGRAKAHGGIEDVKTWRNAFIFTGEEPVTKASSGGGVKNRVIEIEVRDKIIPDGNKTANLVKENYGGAGKRFVEYIQSIDDKKIQDDYKVLFKSLIESCDTTEKQAMSMAIILLADKYACNSIFIGSSNLKVEDVKQYLASQKTVETSERAFDWVVNWIAENSIRFLEDSEQNKGAVWGRIENGIAIVNKNVLTKAMNDAGFDYNACSRKWGEQDRLVRNTQGRFVHQTTIRNIRASYIKIQLEEEQLDIAFEEAGEDNPFIQEDLPI